MRRREASQRREVFDAPEEARVAHHERGRVVSKQRLDRREVRASVRAERRHVHGRRSVVHGAEVGARRVDGVRVKACAQDHVLPLRHAPRHEHGLGAAARGVVHGGVRDLHPEELADERLKLVYRLERPLAHLRLIRRVGRVELRAEQQLIDRRRDVVVVHAAAQEREGAGAGVALAQLLQVPHERRLVERRLEVERLRHQRRRYGGEEIVERGHADALEHKANLVGRVRQVAHANANPGPWLASVQARERRTRALTRSY